MCLVYCYFNYYYFIFSLPIALERGFIYFGYARMNFFNNIKELIFHFFMHKTFEHMHVDCYPHQYSAFILNLFVVNYARSSYFCAFIAKCEQERERVRERK